MNESNNSKINQKSIVRTYSRYTEEALHLLAISIRSTRLEKKLTAENVAQRAGTSRSMIQRIEKGDPTCGIGVVFEVATVVGVSLFEPESDLATLANHRRSSEEKLSLLPQRAKQPIKKVYDEF